jgi:hypothetical protein
LADTVNVEVELTFDEGAVKERAAVALLPETEENGADVVNRED